MLGNFGVIVDELKDLGARIKAKPDVMFGTVSSVSGSTAQVVIDGDATATPCALFCACGPGDRVTVIRRGVSCVAVARDNGDAPATVTTETTVADIITAGSGITISAANFARWGKVAMLQLAFSKSTATSTGTNITIGTVKEGYRPIYAATAGGTRFAGWLTNAGNFTCTNYGANITANTTVYISTTFLLP